MSVTQIPNPSYATTITTTSQATLQAAIAHHGTMPNNLDLVTTLVNLSPQQLIVFTTNNPPTIDAPTFVNPVGELFQVHELKFPVKSSKKNLQLTTFFRQKDETFKMLYRRLLKLKENIQSIIDLEATHWYLRLLESTLTLHVKVLQWVFVKFADSYILQMCTTFLKS